MNKFLDKYIEDWKLENCNKLVSTFTSDIYIAESRYGKVILKILNDIGIEDELPGTYFLKNCNGYGSVKLFEFDEKALLIEYLPGENLYQYSKAGSELKASKVFCEIIKKIHDIKEINHATKLINYKNLFKIFDRIEFPVKLKELMDKGKNISKNLVSSQCKEVLLHGDLHHENVISRANGKFVCFDPKGFIGDPAYELGTTLKNPWDYPQISQDIILFQERAKYFSNELNLPYERIVGFAFVHLCLSIAWAIEDECNYDHQLKLIQKVDQIL